MTKKRGYDLQNWILFLAICAFCYSAIYDGTVINKCFLLFIVNATLFNIG